MTSIIGVFLLLFVAPGAAYIALTSRFERGLSCSVMEMIAISLSLTILAGYVFNTLGVMNALSYWAFFVLVLVLLGFGTYLNRNNTANPPGKWAVSDLVHAAIWLGAVLLLLPAYFENSGKIISSWDALFVWDTHARAFANDTIAPTAGHYPQGLGALGAAIYTLSGNLEQTILNRQITNIFPILSVVSLAVIYRPKNFGVLAVSVICFLIIHARFDSIQHGYAYSYTADMFVFSSILVIIAAIKTCLLDDDFQPVLYPENLKNTELVAICVLLGLCAALAANAKQLGTVMLAVTPLSALLLTKGLIMPRLKFALWIGAACFIAGAGWYVHVFLGILAGGGKTNSGFLLLGVHQGRDTAQRIIYGLENISTLTGWPMLIGLGFGSVMALFTRFGRLLFFVALVPMAIFYLLIAGYAPRNSTPVLAVLLVLAGLGLKFSVQMILRRFPVASDKISKSLATPLMRLPAIRLPAHTLVLIVGLFIGVGTAWAKLNYEDRFMSWLKAEETRQSASLGWMGINTMMERLMNGQSPGSYIFTNYRVADRLPQLSAFEVVANKGYSMTEIESMSERYDQMNIFILWYDRSSKKFQAYLQCLEDENLYEMINYQHGTTKWKFMRKVPSPTWDKRCVRT